MDHGMIIFRDIQFTLRTLRQNPAFALSVVLALGLGIGANTAIFSVADNMRAVALILLIACTAALLIGLLFSLAPA
jgi:hypothetical protein